MQEKWPQSPDEQPRQDERAGSPGPRQSQNGVPRWASSRNGAPAPGLFSGVALGQRVQRKGEEGEAPELLAASPAPMLLVEDEAEGELAPGQMRKGEFLELLRAEVCATADAALAGTIWSSAGCSYIERWFGYYAGRDAARVEHVLRRYAPETTGVSDARAYVPLVCARVRSGIETWVGTGEVTGVPEGVEAGLPAGEVEQASQETEALQTKSLAGGARAASPSAVRSSLGGGEALAGDVRGRMETAFGASFSDVRLHTDTGAAGLARGLRARAFTVGEHVAFGAGEYRPGTPVGDALLAHELAHVAQQRGGEAGGGASYGALEEDADRSAVGAVLSLWNGAGELAGRTLPSLRSGLRLQSCPSDEKEPAETTGSGANSPASPVKLPADAGAKPPAADAGPKPPVAQAGGVTFPAGCKNEAALKGIIAANPGSKDWEVEAVVKGDTISTIVRRVKQRRPDLYTGRAAVYAERVDKLHGSKPLQIGHCVVLPVGWRDPNIGTLPAKPATLTADSAVTQAVAIVYSEQTGTSANAQEQQLYIWYSIRKRVASARYPADLSAVLDRTQYHAIGTSDYTAAVADLTSGDPPKLPGVANAKQAVLDHWNTTLPADAGAAYFHWRDKSTPNRLYKDAKLSTPAEKEAKEKELAWNWAREIKIAGSVSKTSGWLKRIRGDSEGPLGSMYIYPGDEE